MDYLTEIKAILGRGATAAEQAWLTDLQAKVESAFANEIHNSGPIITGLVKLLSNSPIQSPGGILPTSLEFVELSFLKGKGSFYSNITQHLPVDSQGADSVPPGANALFPEHRHLLLVGRLRVANITGLNSDRLLSLCQSTSMVCETLCSDPSLLLQDKIVVCGAWSYIPPLHASAVLPNGYLELSHPLLVLPMNDTPQSTEVTAAQQPKAMENLFNFQGSLLALSPVFTEQGATAQQHRYVCIGELSVKPTATIPIVFYDDLAMGVHSILDIGQEYKFRQLVPVLIKGANGSWTMMCFRPGQSTLQLATSLGDSNLTQVAMQLENGATPTKRKRSVFENGSDVETSPAKRPKLTQPEGKEASPAPAIEVFPLQSAQEGLVTYTGLITAVEPKECRIVLDHSCSVYLTKSTLCNHGVGLRTGAKIRLHHVHVIRTGAGIFQGFGWCARSKISILAFSRLYTPFYSLNQKTSPFYPFFSMFSFGDYVDIVNVHTQLRRKFQKIVDISTLLGPSIEETKNTVLGGCLNLKRVILPKPLGKETLMDVFLSHNNSANSCGSDDYLGYFAGKHIALIDLADLPSLPQVQIVQGALNLSTDLPSILRSEDLAKFSLVGWVSLKPIAAIVGNWYPQIDGTTLFFSDTTGSIPLVVSSPTTAILDRICRINAYSLVFEPVTDNHVMYLQCAVTDLEILDLLPIGSTKARLERAELVLRQVQILAALVPVGVPEAVVPVSGKKSSHFVFQVEKVITLQDSSNTISGFKCEGLCVFCNASSAPHATSVVFGPDYIGYRTLLHPGGMFYFPSLQWNSFKELIFEPSAGPMEEVFLSSHPCLPRSVGRHVISVDSWPSRARRILAALKPIEPTKLTTLLLNVAQQTDGANAQGRVDLLRCVVVSKAEDKPKTDTYLHPNKRSVRSLSKKRRLVVRGADVLDELIIFGQESTFFLGCLPGTVIVISNLVLKQSKAMCYGSLEAATFLSVESATHQQIDPYLPTIDFSNLKCPSRRLIELYDRESRIGKSVFHSIVTVREIVFLVYECMCSKCSTIVLRDKCPHKSCKKEGRKFSARMTCLLDDGTAVVKATWMDVPTIFEILRMPEEFVLLLQDRIAYKGTLTFSGSKLFQNRAELETPEPVESGFLKYIEAVKTEQGEPTEVFLKRFYNYSPQYGLESHVLTVDVVNSRPARTGTVQSETQKLLDQLKYPKPVDLSKQTKLTEQPKKGSAKNDRPPPIAQTN